MEGYSGGIVWSFILLCGNDEHLAQSVISFGLFYGLRHHSDRHLLFYYLKKTN